MKTQEDSVAAVQMRLLEMIRSCYKDQIIDDNDPAISLDNNLLSLRPVLAILVELTTQRKFTHMSAILATEIDYPLAEMFVELSVATVRQPTSALRINPLNTIADEIEEEYRRITASRLSVEKATQTKQHHSFVILGDPGCGKTSLLKSLAQGIALGGHQRWSLPLFISLREYWRDRQSSDAHLSLLDYAVKAWVSCDETMTSPNSSVQDLKPGRYQTLLKAVSTGEQSVVFLLDGYDEVSSQTGAADLLEHEIKELSKWFPWVLTSRQTGFFGGLDQDVVYEVAALNNESISTLVSNWFAHQLPDADTDLRKSRLMTEIRTATSLERMARNPFLLSLLCSLSTNSTTPLPRQRSRIYQEIIKLILTQAQLLKKDPTLFDYSYMQNLGSFCHYLYSDADQAPRQIFEQNHWNQFFADSEAPSLENLIQHSRLLTAWPGLLDYHFVHLTFHEYFVAQHLASKQLVPGQIKELIHKPGWRMVMRFYAGMLTVQARHEELEQMLQLLLKDPDDIGILHGEAAWWLVESDIEDSTTLINHDLREVLWSKYRDKTPMVSEMLGDAMVSMSPQWVLDRIESEFVSSPDDVGGDLPTDLITLLGKINHPHADDLIISCFCSATRSVRQRAVAMIAYKNTTELRQRLLQTIAADTLKKDDNLRRDVSELARKTRNADYLPFLLTCLHNEEVTGRPLSLVLEGISSIGSADAAPTLISYGDRLSLPLQPDSLIKSMLSIGSEPCQHWLDSISKRCDVSRSSILTQKLKLGLDTPDENRQFLEVLKNAPAPAMIDAILERVENGFSIDVSLLQALYHWALSDHNVADHALSNLEAIENQLAVQGLPSSIPSTQYREALQREMQNSGINARTLDLMLILSSRRDGDTLPLICTLATDSKQSAHNRVAAITCLAGYKKYYRDTCLNLLRGLAHSESGGEVLLAALEELGKISPVELLTLPPGPELTEAKAVVSSSQGVRYVGDHVFGQESSEPMSSISDTFDTTYTQTQLNEYLRALCKHLFDSGMATHAGKNNPLFKKENGIDSITSKTGSKLLKDETFELRPQDTDRLTRHLLANCCI